MHVKMYSFYIALSNVPSVSYTLVCYPGAADLGGAQAKAERKQLT